MQGPFGRFVEHSAGGRLSEVHVLSSRRPGQASLAECEVRAVGLIEKAKGLIARCLPPEFLACCANRSEYFGGPVDVIFLFSFLSFFQVQVSSLVLRSLPNLAESLTSSLILQAI